MIDGPDPGGGGFLRGLLQPHPVSVVTALATGVALALGAGLFVDESFAASPALLHFAPRRGAHSITVTSRLLRLEQDAPSERQVLVLGNSGVRNSVDTARLQQRLRAEVGDDVTVLGLCSAAQPIALAHGMLERVPRSTRGILVLGVGMRQLADTRESCADLGRRQRLGLRSDALDEAIREVGGDVPSRIGVYAWDNRNYLGPRFFEGVLPNLFSELPTPVAMPHAGKPPHSPEHYDAMLEVMSRHFRAYGANVSRNVAQLERLLADAARYPQLDVVLLQSVVNPEFLDRYALRDERADYDRRLDDVARRHDVPLLRLDRRAGLDAEDFRDAVHVRTVEGHRRYTDALADALVKWLAEQDE